jgi:YidC/Oxa1 family membrane protein insertase
MLTVLVRSCMYPLSRKQTLNAHKMQELMPEIKRLKEKHKNDAQGLMKAQQALFRKHNYNQFSGCLPALVQLPIFVGLYRALMVDVELRQAPLISDAVRWCSNLAAPDMLFDWSAWMPAFVTTGFLNLGPYFNVLPLVTVALFLWQQKLFMPPAVDEQTAMQQKMMKWMMVIMGVMFYKVASGLCLYFIVSTSWSILERKVLLPKPPAPPQPAPALVAAPGGNGSPSEKRRKKERRG